MWEWEARQPPYNEHKTHAGAATGRGDEGSRFGLSSYSRRCAVAHDTSQVKRSRFRTQNYTPERGATTPCPSASLLVLSSHLADHVSASALTGRPFPALPPAAREQAAGAAAAALVPDVVCVAARESAAHYLQQGAHAGHRATPRSPMAKHRFPWFAPSSQPSYASQGSAVRNLILILV